MDFCILCRLVLLLLTSQVIAVPLQTRQVDFSGGSESLTRVRGSQFSADNLLTGSLSDVVYTAQEGEQLPIAIVNNFENGQLYAYVVGLDPNNAPVFLDTNQQWYYPKPTSSGVPEAISANISWPLGALGTISSLTIPTFLSSGRVYVSDGELSFFSVVTPDGVAIVQPDFNNIADPSTNLNWAYIELTRISAGTWTDITYVDFVGGLPLGLSLTSASGKVSSVTGVDTRGADNICNGLQEYAQQEGQPWDKLCQYSNNGTLLRVISPAKYTATNEGAFGDYYTSYAQEVISRYSGSPSLSIDGQTGSTTGIQCSGSGNNINCQGGNRAFSAPTAKEIFGCDGTFQVLAGDNAAIQVAAPRLCAAFNRGTFLVDGGSVQPGPPVSSYYTTTPSNRYSQLVHAAARDGVGYAFPYDDVNPSGSPDQSGTLASSDATLISIFVGNN